MAGVDLSAEAKRLEAYLSELENTNRKLALENSQLRASHSYRLGNALVAFAKRKSLGAFPALLKDLKLAAAGKIVATPEPLKRPALLLAQPIQKVAPDNLQKAVEEPPVGSSVVVRIEGKGPATVVGIMGGDIRARLGSTVTSSNIRFDRYDLGWREQGITHIVIEVDQLPNTFGWEQVFTLRDPAATVEMVVMLQKARLAQIKTILITPSQAYKYPLLGRARPFFERELKRAELTIDKIVQ